MRRCSHSARAFGGLDGQRLDGVRLEELAGLLPLLGSFADARARGHHEQRQMIAPAVLGIEDVVAQAQAVVAALPAEAEGVDGRRAAGREQVDRVAVALGFEELPDRLHLHEARGFLLHLFHVVEQFQRLLVVLRQRLLEIALVAQVPAVEHERIDVAPHLGQVRHVAHLAVQIGRGRNRNDRCALCGCGAWSRAPSGSARSFHDGRRFQ